MQINNSFRENTEVSSVAIATNVAITYQPILPGMTSTPTQGTYQVIFSGIFRNSASAGKIFISIFVGGIQNVASERSHDAFSNSEDFIMSTNGIVEVNGAEAIEIRWRNLVISNTSNSFNRSMNLIRLS